MFGRKKPQPVEKPRSRTYVLYSAREIPAQSARQKLRRELGFWKNQSTQNLTVDIFSSDGVIFDGSDLNSLDTSSADELVKYLSGRRYSLEDRIDVITTIPAPKIEKGRIKIPVDITTLIEFEKLFGDISYKEGIRHVYEDLK